jgi:hypothetical protein
VIISGDDNAEVLDVANEIGVTGVVASTVKLPVSAADMQVTEILDRHTKLRTLVAKEVNNDANTGITAADVRDNSDLVDEFTTENTVPVNLTEAKESAAALHALKDLTKKTVASDVAQSLPIADYDMNFMNTETLQELISVSHASSVSEVSSSTSNVQIVSDVANESDGLFLDGTFVTVTSDLEANAAENVAETQISRFESSQIPTDANFNNYGAASCCNMTETMGKESNVSMDGELLSPLCQTAESVGDCSPDDIQIMFGEI